jgi:hypothetical protein
LPDNELSLFSAGGATWNLPQGEQARQAIPALRGYAYQLHQSLAAWIALPAGGTLHLEVAEDYATIASDPGALQEVLTASQVKDTRESGSVTLNSADVLDAVGHLWALQEASPDRVVRLNFLTTSPIAKERINPLANGAAGLEEWRRAARGGPVDAIREALKARLKPPDLLQFVTETDEVGLRERILRPMTWSCGAPGIAEIEADNRSALVELGHELQSTPDLSARAGDILLARILTVIVKTGSLRRVTRGDLLQTFYDAVTLRVPAQVMAAGLTSPAATAGLNLSRTGAWYDLAELSVGTRSRRPQTVASLSPILRSQGALWIHGATGLGKSVLAELVASAQGGAWRYLDLRGAPAASSAERIVAAAGAVGAIAELRGIILDDVAADMDDLDGPLRRLRAALDRRDAICIVTSHNPPGRRVAAALGLTGDAIADAPAFSEEDVASLITAYGGDPAPWIRFAWIVGGGGHPQLVDVVVSGLASRGWPASEMERWVEVGFRSDDVEGERDAARRRLLRELSDQTLQYLCRAAHIHGAFDRDLALVAGRAPPTLENCAASLDRLAGHWIERVGTNRLRASPLVAGLDNQMLPTDQLAKLDREIALHLLSRGTIDADMADIAFIHAVMARAKDLVTPIVVNLIGIVDERVRSDLASTMPFFRTARADLGGLLADEPYLQVLVRLGQHRLISALGEDESTARSASNLVNCLDAVSDLQAKGHLEVMVLSKVLIDPFAFGRIPGWFVLVDRFEAACARSPDIQEVGAGMVAEGQPPPAGFAFMVHAMQLPRLSELEALFQHLDAIEPSMRARRLMALKADASTLSLTIDSPWLKQSRLEVLEGGSQASIYGRLARMAISWDDSALAAQCFRAQAIMLDEYATDPVAALAALDAADQLLPDHLVLKRERAKIAWRSKDYASALDQLSAIADRLETAEPMETAFALREAAISAGELDRWADAWRFFERARQAAVLAAGRPTPLNIGLAGDAAAARFASGDEVCAVCDMRLALEALDGISPTESLKAHYCHIVLRHIVLWMQAQHEPGYAVDGEPVIYVVGSASNPAPLAETADRPLGAIQAGWMMLARVGLAVGMPADELLAWPGVADLQNYAQFDMTWRMDLVGIAAIEAGSLDAFRAYARPAVEAMCFLSSKPWQENSLDIVAPTPSSIPTLEAGPLSEVALNHWRSVAISMACSLVFQNAAFARERLIDLHNLVVELAGSDVVPEWLDGAEGEPGDLKSAVAVLVRRLAHGELIGIQDIYGAQLRFAEWGGQSNYGRYIGPSLATQVKRDWSTILDRSSALLRRPTLTKPAIQQAINLPLTGLGYVAAVLLTAEPATNVNLSEEYRTKLRVMIPATR